MKKIRYIISLVLLLFGMLACCGCEDIFYGAEYEDYLAMQKNALGVFITQYCDYDNFGDLTVNITTENIYDHNVTYVAKTNVSDVQAQNVTKNVRLSTLTNFTLQVKTINGIKNLYVKITKKTTDDKYTVDGNELLKPVRDVTDDATEYYLGKTGEQYYGRYFYEQRKNGSIINEKTVKIYETYNESEYKEKFEGDEYVFYDIREKVINQSFVVITSSDVIQNEHLYKFKRTNNNGYSAETSREFLQYNYDSNEYFDVVINSLTTLANGFFDSATTTYVLSNSMGVVKDTSTVKLIRSANFSSLPSPFEGYKQSTLDNFDDIIIDYNNAGMFG